MYCLRKVRKSQNIFLVSFHRNFHPSPNYNGKIEKLSAFRDLSKRVATGQDSWAWQIQNLAYTINTSSTTTNHEANVLMKACQNDILDLFPADQKLLTEIAKDCVSGCQIKEDRSNSLHKNIVLAYTFQGMELNTKTVLDNMKAENLEPDITTQHLLLDHLCKLSTRDSALQYVEDNQLDLSEQLASSLIFAHAAAGEIVPGENILRALNDRNIHWGKSCYIGFILGSAFSGDVDATKFFLSKLNNSTDELLLHAIQLMNRNHPDRLGFLLDQLPRNVELFSSLSRRTVKVLLESGNSAVALSLVRKCKEVAVNNSDKVRVIKISPSVIFLKHFISTCEDVNLILDRIKTLHHVDSKIISRAVYILLETCLNDNEKVPLAKFIINELKNQSDKKDLEAIDNYVGQSSKRRIADASLKSDEAMLSVFEIYCHLDLRIEKLRAWDIMMKKLIPDFPNEGDWTRKTLEDRCFIAKKLIHSRSNGLYSDSVIWAVIMQTLLNREKPMFFLTAARLAQTLKVVSGPRRWHLSLANCLVRLKDVVAFVDILEVSYWNCDKRNSWGDYSLVAGSLYAAIVKAQNTGVNIDGLLGDILDEIWKRNLRLPPDVRDNIVVKLLDRGHRNMFENVPVLGANVFKSGAFIASRAKDVRIVEAGIENCSRDIVSQITEGDLDMTKLFIKTDVHPQQSDERGIDWVFFADTLNFCFWQPEESPQYTVTYKGTTHTGYLAMCAAINRALDQNVELTSPQYFVGLDEARLGALLLGDNNVPIPLLTERVQCLRQVGEVLRDKFSGRFSSVLALCENSAAKLLQIVLDNFPCFNDSAEFDGTRVSFHKRAQILVADIWCLYEGTGVASFQDIDQLTMFADYRVPQSLQHYGVLQYSEQLQQHLTEDKLLVSGDIWEQEIRGCSIEAVERITGGVKAELDRRGCNSRINSILVDQFLWGYRRKHAELMKSFPYHKVRSIFY